MRYGRHHMVVIVLSWLIILIIGAYGLAENQRMAMAERRQMNESVERGLELFARNCATCHGPKGEGCVGAPLNRKDYQGQPAENMATFDFLYKTIADGRPGTGIPRWVRRGEHWYSYTAMPAWSRAKGGPLNEMHITDLVNFIMLGDWEKVPGKIAEIEKKTREAMVESGQDPDALPLRDAPGLDAAANKRGQELFVSKGCVGCHRIGSRGGSTGPDLSNVGAWGLDRQFLADYLKNTDNPNRIPVFWSNYGPDIDPSRKPVQPGKSVMPPLGLAMTEQELQDLITYLLALRP